MVSREHGIFESCAVSAQTWPSLVRRRLNGSGRFESIWLTDQQQSDADL